MIKILYISDSFKNNAGSGVIAKKTYEIFDTHGFSIALFTSKGYLDDKNYKYSEYFPERYDTMTKYIKNIFKYYYNWDAANKLSHLLEEFQPDLVHCHSLRNSALTYSVLKPVILRKIPIVMTLHDCYLICPMLTLVKKNSSKCNMLCKGINKLPCVLNCCAPKGYEQSLRVAIGSFVNKFTNYDKYISKFITPSNALMNMILNANIGIKKDRITTVNNFLSETELKIIPNYSNQGYFLYIGRLSKEKGIHYLLQAIKDLPSNIKIHIVGKGTEEEKLKQYVQKHNLDNIKFLGHKNREEIKEEYQNCIATILPCNWFEIFGMTNIESFINGKPVIASNIGGIPEIVEHNKTGLLFEPANVEQLKECILTYWNNPNLVIEHGQNAYQKAKTLYTEERYYNELMQVYNEVLEKRKQ